MSSQLVHGEYFNYACLQHEVLNPQTERVTKDYIQCERFITFDYNEQILTTVPLDWYKDLKNGELKMKKIRQMLQKYSVHSDSYPFWIVPVMLESKSGLRMVSNMYLAECVCSAAVSDGCTTEYVQISRKSRTIY